MKVDWKPFDREDPATWPVDKSMVWLTDGKCISLGVTECNPFNSRVWFDPFGSTGYDIELDVEARSATHWAHADLPELPK